MRVCLFMYIQRPLSILNRCSVDRVEITFSDVIILDDNIINNANGQATFLLFVYTKYPTDVLPQKVLQVSNFLYLLFWYGVIPTSSIFILVSLDCSKRIRAMGATSLHSNSLILLQFVKSVIFCMLSS